MKLTLLPLLTTATLAIAACNYQDVGTLSQKWRLSTYSSENCIHQASDVTHSGFGTWCVNFPNGVRSFIFSVGTGYTGANLDDCTIFLYSGNKCSDGTQLGRSRGEWKKSKLSAKAKKMGSATVQCTKLFRREADAESGREKKFVREEDGEWYEEVADGRVVKARVVDLNDEVEVEARTVDEVAEEAE